MKYRYLLVPVFENVVIGTNDEKVFEEWKVEFEEDAVTIIDLASMQWTDAGPSNWQPIEEHKQ